MRSTSKRRGPTDGGLSGILVDHHEALGAQVTEHEIAGTPWYSDSYGVGGQLPYGTTITSGELSCRLDPEGLFGSRRC